MTTYTDVFGTDTVPSSDAKFSAYSLTANQTFNWVYNTSGSAYVVTDIMEVAATAGLTLTFPSATEVSVGESILVRNTGSNTFTINNAADGALGTIVAGTAKLFYVTNNSTAAGVWSVLTFGTGTSSADATTLQGLGVLAIGATLNENHPVVTTSAAYTITTANRANTLVFTGGSVNCTLPTLATATNGFSLLIKNSGSGIVTFVPQGIETIDQLTLSPGDSVFLVAGASGWTTVGFGQNVSFAFTKLNKDLTSYGGATVALSAIEAQNKLISFYGTPTNAVHVTIPAVTSVYFISSELTTYNIIVATQTGASVTLSPGVSTVIICDGVDTSYAISSNYTSGLSLPNGTQAAPSLSFERNSGSGLYAPTDNELGVCVNGSEMFRFYPSGMLSRGTLYLGYSPVTGLPDYGDMNILGGALTMTYDGSANDLVISSGATLNEVTSNALKSFRWTGSAVYIHDDYPAQTWAVVTRLTSIEALRVNSSGSVTFAKASCDVSTQHIVPTTGFSQTVADLASTLVIAPVGTLATGTVTFPSAPEDGQTITITSTQIITALTMSGNGKTLRAPLTTIAVDGFATWKYYSSNSTWYRIG